MGKETLYSGDFDCPSQDISAYIDGELEPAVETAFEEHVFACETCLAELNYQKLFLRNLNLSLRHHDDLELPANFAETVMVQAESSVSGLRRPSEFFNTILVCAALVVFVVVALTFDAASMFPRSADLFEKSAAVFGFLFRLVSSFAIGIGAVLRTLGGRFMVPGAISFIFFGVFVLAFLVVTRMLLRFRRT